jgi:hypothetical protein
VSKQKFTHWRTLPPIPKNVYDAIEHLHEVAKQVVVDCPKDFQAWTQFVLVKGVQTIDTWLTVKLNESLKSGKPTIDAPGALTKALQQGEVEHVLAQIGTVHPSGVGGVHQGVPDGPLASGPGGQRDADDNGAGDAPSAGAMNPGGENPSPAG